MTVDNDNLPVQDDSETPEYSLLEKVILLNPALLRGLVVSGATAIVAIFGVVIDDGTVNAILNFLFIALGILTALFIRPAVTANAKVIAWTPDPTDDPNVIKAGDAFLDASPAAEAALIDAAFLPTEPEPGEEEEYDDLLPEGASAIPSELEAESLPTEDDDPSDLDPFGEGVPKS